MTSPFAIGNFYLFASMLLGAGAQVLLKRLLGAAGPSPELRTIITTLIYERPLAVVAVGAMILASAGLWLASLTRLPLSYAFPIACGSALFVMGLSAAFLGEAVTWRAALGAALIVLGTALLVPAG